MADRFSTTVLQGVVETARRLMLERYFSLDIAIYPALINALQDWDSLIVFHRLIVCGYAMAVLHKVRAASMRSRIIGATHSKRSASVVFTGRLIQRSCQRPHAYQLHASS